jgi:hypothetical protein
MAEKETEGNQSNEQREINFRYIKSNLFRVVHADGAFGGISPRGNIHFSLYNERIALPDSSKITVSDKTGEVIGAEKFKNSGSIVREIEVDVVTDLPTAMQLYKWLGNKIAELQALIKEAQGEGVTDAEKKRTNAIR